MVDGEVAREQFRDFDRGWVKRTVLERAADEYDRRAVAVAIKRDLVPSVDVTVLVVGSGILFSFWLRLTGLVGYGVTE